LGKEDANVEGQEDAVHAGIQDRGGSTGREKQGQGQGALIQEKLRQKAVIQLRPPQSGFLRKTPMA